jgi:exodeoxyribonuclease-3
LVKKSIQIVSWNVNGIRACLKKGFLEWLQDATPDILGLQETRVSEEQIPSQLFNPLENTSYTVNFSPAQRAGYSGVALFSQIKPTKIVTQLGVDEFDIEGRFQWARFGKLSVVNVYFPNGSGKNRDNSRVPYKLRFFEQVNQLFQKRKKRGERILVMGDYNIAHREIDLARPKSNKKTSGFLPEERQVMDQWLEEGWIDTFRTFHPEPENYTWWSQRSGARERNVGWRIDYILASKGAMPFVRDASIHPEVTGSDHCPIRVSVDPAIFE